ncbi:MAG: polyribonucleotide nucleotidyltransferase [Saprospiraceae bacterium]|nr:polyribonucleotide nucleotidyltransferase [Saprospiraceae bacterium]MDP4998778.1 polyribonucleotide nucleotidyltransferase [Saprospiraceae bacterium]
MGQQIPISTSFDLPDGRTITLETGKLASLADGAVLVRLGNTMLLATVVSAKEAKEGQDFFPLSVDYQEKFAAVGRIPGNFFRREARLSDYEVLICRLVDRAIRPLFPDGYRNETQVVINLISADKDAMPDALAGLAASAALAVSNIAFAGPISEVRVARINGEFVINPDRPALAEADLAIIVAGTMDSVVMVEGESKECEERDLVEAIRIGHEAIKVQCAAQLRLAEMVGEKATVKRAVAPKAENKEVEAMVAAFAEGRLTTIVEAALDKQTRKDQFKVIKEELVAHLTETHGEEFMAENGGFVEGYYDKLKKNVVRNVVLDKGLRLDGRKTDEIRPIWCEVDYLPSTHGSALFTRGETQSLTSLTLGTKLDEMMQDHALDFHFEKFILHYNFPPYSVGEARPMRGPGRREIGHANLAARSLRQVLPDDNPYTLRIVSDILESNGSSSMATVCAGSLALMDGGIQIKSPVSGIAMGLISDGQRTAILSDILGDEDALGDMDFKVTGTEKGITGCQMDIKIEGLSYDLLIEALEQAKKGRLHILEKMKEAIAEPRADLKPHAPRMVELMVEKSFIGAIIGPGGKVIQEIQEKTKTVINIEEVGDKGIVNISSSNKEAIDAAVAWVNRITFTPQIGDVYQAVVKTVMPYGVFVDFNGKSGLLHVSEISHTHIEKVEDVFKEGDDVKVKLIGVDPKTGKLRLSRKALISKPQKGPGAGKGRDAEDGEE